MRITKIYGIYGRTTAIVKVPTGSGKAYIEVEFNRGIPNAGPNYRPATYATSDPVEQSILEKSSLFGSLYTIYRVRRDDGVAPAALPNVKKPAPAGKTKTSETPKTGNEEKGEAEVKVIEEVKTKGDALEWLKQNGAKATNLKNDDTIKAFMAKIGVSFPNVEF